MPTWRATEYADVAEGSPEPGFVLDSGRAARTIKVPWNLQEQAKEDFVGWADVRVNENNVAYIHRETPHPYPGHFNRQGLPWIWCVGMPTIKGVNPQGTDINDLQSYNHAYCNLSYSSLTYKICDDADTLGLAGSFWVGVPDESRMLRYVTRLHKPATKILTLSTGMMLTVNDADPTKRIPIKEGLPFREAAAEISYTWHVVPEAGVPHTAIAQGLTSINDAAFNGFAAETLRLETVDIRPQNSPLGDRVFDVSYKMTWMPKVSPITGAQRGHNYIIRRLPVGDPNVGKLDYVLVSSDGTSAATALIHRKTDFRKLFNPDQ